jgi:DNA-binding NtrC family response regulator
MKPGLLVIASDGDKLTKSLQSEDWDLRLVRNLEEATKEFNEGHLYDLIFVEVDDLADSVWRETLRMIAEPPRSCEVIVCCRNGEEDQWAKVLEAGAFDLITGPYYKPEIHRIARRALTDQSLHRLAHVKTSLV